MVRAVADQESYEDLFHSPRRESAVELVVNRIKSLLLEGRIQPGDRLPNEVEIARSLSVSRNSVREGMKILAALGVVDIRRGDGTYVPTEIEQSSMDPLLFSLILARADSRKMIELREMVELGVSRLVIRNATAADLEEIRRRFSEMTVLGGNASPGELTACDLAFHFAMARATQNELVEKIYRFVLQYFEPTIGKTHARPENRASVLALHQDILEALEARDEERTARAVRASITGWIEHAT